MTTTDLWRQAAASIHWYRAPTIVLDDSNPPFYRWYPDGVTNACYNALDLHVEQGRGEQAALIYDSPVTDTRRQYTYSQLLDEVSRFAGVLASRGVGKGDRVIVYMPMVPEAMTPPPTTTTCAAAMRSMMARPMRWTGLLRLSTRLLNWRITNPTVASSCRGLCWRPRWSKAGI